VNNRIHRLTQMNIPRLRDFWIEQWGSDFMVAHNDIIRYDQTDGFIYEDWSGLVTFMIRGEECEITSLDSLKQGKGIGTALIEEVIREAKARN
jgi:GNAT superfamily N-acetyltransferase